MFHFIRYYGILFNYKISSSEFVQKEVAGENGIG